MPLVASVLAAAVTALLCPIAIRIAWATGWLDHPEARKLHTAATPLLGGVVVLLGALAGSSLLFVRHTVDGEPGRRVVLVLAGALVSLVWGLWDDRRGMGVPLKLTGQLIASALLLAAGTVPDLGLPVWLEIVIALFGLVSLMNAINFLDNMNGMVGGIVGVTLLFHALHSLWLGNPALATLELALAGACAGFLPFNFPRARIFLGDAGSLFLGYSLGASTALVFAGSPPGWGRVGPLFGLAYPAFDLIFVVANRLREGRKVSQGGKDHSNHRLARVISCPKRTVILVWCSTAVLCASGLVVQDLSRPLPTLLLSGLWILTLSWAGYRLSSVPSGAPIPIEKS
jgi:UDP-GlcNAc:undecaprenyl-phosphate GlcNAc-1-phosphate transferase